MKNISEENKVSEASPKWLMGLNPFGAVVPIRDGDEHTNPNDSPAAWPHLFFQVFPADDGDPAGPRTTAPEFLNRTPVAVVWNMAERRVYLNVSNGGRVASDLVRVDYQIRYCTYPGHAPTEGFSVDHAFEAGGSSKDDLLTLDFIPAKSAIAIEVDLEDFATSCENLYIRARVCGLFSPSKPSSTWDFSNDPSVVEGWHKP